MLGFIQNNGKGERNGDSLASFLLNLLPKQNMYDSEKRPT